MQHSYSPYLFIVPNTSMDDGRAMGYNLDVCFLDDNYTIFCAKE